MRPGSGERAPFPWRTMPVKKNCWEKMQCGRQPGGFRVDDLGLCPAATAVGLHGTHGGKNAGRACWVVAGTLCGGEIQASFAKKFNDCQICEFYQEVKAEESGKFKMSIVLLNMYREIRA
jgi:hypothetical protein